MVNGEISTSGLSRKIEAIVGQVQNVLKREGGEYYDPRLVRDSITHCVGNVLDRLEEGLLERITTPGRREYQELLAFIEQHKPLSDALAEVEESVYLAHEYGLDTMFEGNRSFSKRKMAAMIEYLTSKGNHVYKTSLNKLLFYSDLTSFYLRNQGISGAVYFNRPFGPVATPSEPTLNELIREEKITVEPRLKTLTAATDAADASEVLSADERRILDWVSETYGELNASAISDLSHREAAYKYTEPNEPIAYAYGKFFKNLPPKDFLKA